MGAIKQRAIQIVEAGLATYEEIYSGAYDVLEDVKEKIMDKIKIEEFKDLGHIELQKAAIRDKLQDAIKGASYIEGHLAERCTSLQKLQQDLKEVIKLLNCSIPF